MFNMLEYRTRYIEQFVLPYNWPLGDTTGKTIVAIINLVNTVSLTTELLYSYEGLNGNIK